MWTWIGLVLGLLAVVALYDVTQKQHTILRNFPVIGHFRYLLEAVEVTSDRFEISDGCFGATSLLEL